MITCVRLMEYLMELLLIEVIPLFLILSMVATAIIFRQELKLTLQIGKGMKRLLLRNQDKKSATPYKNVYYHGAIRSKKDSNEF